MFTEAPCGRDGRPGQKHGIRVCLGHSGRACLRAEPRGQARARRTTGREGLGTCAPASFYVTTGPATWDTPAWMLLVSPQGEPITTTAEPQPPREDARGVSLILRKSRENLAGGTVSLLPVCPEPVVG